MDRYSTNIEHNGDCPDCAHLEKQLDKERGDFQLVEANMYSEIKDLRQQLEAEKKKSEELLKDKQDILTVVENIILMPKDKGVDGCTYGDTEHNSIAVVYGYNLALDYLQHIAREIFEKHKR